MEDREPFEALELASFLRPGETLSPSGAAGRRTVLSIIDSEIDSEKGRAGDITEAEEPDPPEDEEKSSNSLADFCDVEAILAQEGGKKKTIKRVII